MAIIIGDKIFSGDNISISRNRVIINGTDITDQLPDQKHYNIVVDGPVNSINCDACDQITVHGAVGSIKTMSGDVECGDVDGSISTMSGDVDCGTVSGNIKTMSGDVKHKKG